MPRRHDSRLATVMFTDIVGSSAIAEALGDRRWRVLLGRHNDLIRRELRRWGGRELDTAGDGFFSTFGDPASAIRCAAAIVRSVQDLGIDVRVGLHVGQAEVVGRKLGGVVVHVGARVMALAGPGQILVTSVARDLVPGAGFQFVDRGSHALKGIGEEQHLFQLTDVDQAPVPRPLDPEAAAERLEKIEVPALLGRRRDPLLLAGGGTAIVGAVVVALLLWSSNSAPSRRPVRLSGNAVGIVDPKAGHLIGSIPLAGSPTAIASGLGSIWVAQDNGLVSRIDPKTHHVQDIGISGTPSGIAVGNGKVWVVTRDGVIFSICPGCSTSQVSSLDAALAGVAVTRHAIWAVGWVPKAHFFGDEAMAYEVDPVTGRTLSRVDLGGGAAFSVAVGERAVWIAGFGIVKLEGTRPRVSATIEETAGGITVGHGAVWAAGGFKGARRIDPATDSVTARINVGDDGHTQTGPEDPVGGAVAVAPDAVWFLAPNAVVRVDPGTNEVVQLIPLHETGNAVAVAPDGNVWVAAQSAT